MAKKPLTASEKAVWKKYRKMKGSTFPNTKVNEFIIYPNNSYDHEKSKFDIYWEHRQQGCNVITECWLGNDRPDLVCLTCDETYEVETDMKRAVRFIGKPINIIPAGGWSLTDEKWLTLKTKEASR